MTNAVKEYIEKGLIEARSHYQEVKRNRVKCAIEEINLEECIKFFESELNKESLK